MMTPQDETELLSDRQLTTLAGEAAFGRGVEYYREGMVVGWNKQGSTITADVEGNERYRVVLKLSKRGLEGGCDCPASEGIDFCKHCVAVALSYRANEAEQARLTQGDATDRVQAYLQQMDKPSLVEALQSLIEHDPVLRQQWSLRADAVLGVLDHKALKKRITAAFPINRDLYRYGQVSAYFVKAETVVEQLAEQAPQLPADKCLTLVDYALSRMARALETIDDSGGFRFHCEATLQTLHIQTMKRLDWAPDRLAAYLFDKAFSDQSDMYPEVPEAYGEVLGEAGLEAYHACLQRVWDELPELPAHADWSEHFRYLRLRDPLIKRAEAAGDLPALLELYRKTANDEKDCLDAAKACMAHDAWDRVEPWLKRAASAESKDPPRWENERQQLQVRLLLHRGESEDAARLQWGIYQTTLRLEDYRDLIQLADEHRLSVDYRQHAHDWLTEWLHNGPQPRFAWEPTAANCLLQIHLEEGRLNEALALCKEREVSANLLHVLAKALTDISERLPLYRRLVRSHVQRTNNDSYRQAIALLQELNDAMSDTADHQAFASLLGELRSEFKQKRNFIKWLKESFPH